MIHYTNLSCLSDKEMGELTDRLERDGAATITVVLERDGEITVMSPQSAELTAFNLAMIGFNFPVYMAKN